MSASEVVKSAKRSVTLDFSQEGLGLGENFTDQEVRGLLAAFLESASQRSFFQPTVDRILDDYISREGSSYEVTVEGNQSITVNLANSLYKISDSKWVVLPAAATHSNAYAEIYDCKGYLEFSLEKGWCFVKTPTMVKHFKRGSNENFLTRDESLRERAKRECDLFKMLYGETAFMFYESADFAMPKFPGKRLHCEHFPNQSLEQCLGIALSSLTELERLHGLNMAHRDIKPDNILFDDQKGEVCFVDFGSACCLGLQDSVFRNTEGYGDPIGLISASDCVSSSASIRVPANVDSRLLARYQQADVYSMGVTLAHWFGAKFSDEKKPDKGINFDTLFPEGNPGYQLDEEQRSKIRLLLERMCDKQNVSNRPTVQEVLREFAVITAGVCIDRLQKIRDGLKKGCAKIADEVIRRRAVVAPEQPISSLDDVTNTKLLGGLSDKESEKMQYLLGAGDAISETVDTVDASKKELSNMRGRLERPCRPTVENGGASLTDLTEDQKKDISSLTQNLLHDSNESNSTLVTPVGEAPLPAASASSERGISATNSSRGEIRIDYSASRVKQKAYDLLMIKSEECKENRSILMTIANFISRLFVPIASFFKGSDKCSAALMEKHGLWARPRSVRTIGDATASIDNAFRNPSPRLAATAA